MTAAKRLSIFQRQVPVPYYGASALNSAHSAINCLPLPGRDESIECTVIVTWRAIPVVWIDLLGRA